MRVTRLSSDVVPVSSLSFERSTHLQVNCPRFSANSICDILSSISDLVTECSFLSDGKRDP